MRNVQNKFKVEVLEGGIFDFDPLSYHITLVRR
jgi:hypothetical protein